MQPGIRKGAPIHCFMANPKARARATARKLNQTFEEVVSHLEKGEVWCPKGKHWTPRASFEVTDTCRLASNCRAHNNLSRKKKGWNKPQEDET